MKVIIAGSRTVRDRKAVFDILDEVHAVSPITEVVSGKQVSYDEVTGEKYGADYLGECWAKSMGIPIKEFPANWRKYGRRAGFKRNVLMGDYGESLIAFWMNESRGTGHMINIMKTLKKRIKICRMK